MRLTKHLHEDFDFVSVMIYGVPMALFIAIAATIIVLFSGCGTVTPNYTEANEIAFGQDGFQDAGLKNEVVDRKTGVRMVLLPNSDRIAFNKDVSVYGATLFNPPIIENEGWYPFEGKYAVRNDIFVDYVEMKKLSAPTPSPK